MTISYPPSLTSPLVRLFSFPCKGDNTTHCISETTPILPRMWIANFAPSISGGKAADRRSAPIMRSGLKPVSFPTQKQSFYKLFLTAKLHTCINRFADGSKDFFILAVAFVVFLNQHQYVVDIDFHLLDKAPCRELDDFRKSPLLQSSRGSYTSPALSCDSYPFVDLPPMNDCKQSFTADKFIFSPRPC